MIRATEKEPWCATCDERHASASTCRVARVLDLWERQVAGHRVGARRDALARVLMAHLSAQDKHLLYEASELVGRYFQHAPEENRSGTDIFERECTRVRVDLAGRKCDADLDALLTRMRGAK